jgi:hypothetical protein
MIFPYQVIFGRDTFDEPEPGLGLLVYEEGVRFYGTHLPSLRGPGDGKPHYGITPLFSMGVLPDLLAFFERTSEKAEDLDPGCRWDLGEGFLMTSHLESGFQRLHLFCEAYDSVYAEQEECWGATEVEIHVAQPAFRLFLAVLREISVVRLALGDEAV